MFPQNGVRMKTVISLFAMLSFLVGQAALVADKEDASLKVRVRIVDGSEPRKQKVADVEAWIFKAVARAGYALASPKTEWTTLSAELKRLETGNGHYIDGSVTQEKGEFKVEIEGCAGLRLHAAARMKMKAGERTVVGLEAGESKTVTFIALEVIEKK